MTGTEEKTGCLTTLRKLFGQSPPKPEVLPYEMRYHFLSAAEVSFYHVLRAVVRDRVAICPKVRMLDILYVRNLRENYAYLGKISKKHVDFLLCNPKSMKPILAIELDDSSHKRSSRAARDAFVNRAFETAGLPLLHVPAQRSYQTGELAALIAPYFEARTKTAASEQ